MANPSSFLCATVVDDEQWSQKFLASESSLEPQCRPPSVAVDRSCIATVYSEMIFEFSRPFLFVYIWCSDRPSCNLTNFFVNNFVTLFFSDGGKEIIWATCGPNRITRPRIWPLAPWQPRHSHPNVYRNIRWYTTTPTSTFTGLVAPAPTS